jgi:DNA-binding IclR family transcriptional regulator
MEKQTSLVKAFQILESLAQNGPMGLNSIAAHTGFPASTVHRILATLGHLGYIRQENGTRQYGVSLKMLELTQGLREDLDIVTVARPIMREAMEATGETVNLVVFEDSEAVYVEQINNTRSLLRMFTKVGARVPLYCSGVGKAFLANQPQEKALEYLSRTQIRPLTQHTIVDKAALLRELDQVRAAGFARDKEEIENGVACVAAPIWHAGKVVGGLSISGPSNRVTDETAPELGQEVVRAALEITKGLEFLDSPLESAVR